MRSHSILATSPYARDTLTRYGICMCNLRHLRAQLRIEVAGPWMARHYQRARR